MVPDAPRDFSVVLDRCDERLDGPAARRLFHGRGRCYPGYETLVVDWYPPYVIVGVFGDNLSSDEIAVLSQRLSQLAGVEGILVQYRDGPRTRSEVAFGQVPDTIVVAEADLSFSVQPRLNQNLGFFLDMAPVRGWLRERCAGARVLNLFAYTCAFSVYAVAGDARLVVNNDMSRAALDWGRQNHILNGHDLRRVRFVPHNLFKSWWKLRQFGPYDVLIIDPPTRQRGSFVAEKDYGQVLKRIPTLAAPGARVVACLNSPFLPFEFLVEQMARRCPECHLVDRLQPSVDFEEAEAAQALKVAVFEYRGAGG